MVLLLLQRGKLAMLVLWMPEAFDDSNPHVKGFGQQINHNNTLTIASTYQPDLLKLFTIHNTESIDSETRSQYYMTEIGCWYLLGSKEQFIEVTHFRNARDWALEQRRLLIAHANDRTKKIGELRRLEN
jgi:hypothetical protein